MWISVDKELPEDDGLVWVFSNNQASYKGYFDGKEWHPDFPTELLEDYTNWNNLHIHDIETCIIPDVTHWMKIEPPEDV